MKKILLLLAVVAAAYLGFTPHNATLPNHEPEARHVSVPGDSSSTPANAIDRGENHRHVEIRGNISRLLPDDTTGIRHQKFLVRLPSGQTVLVAHNIDISTRVEPIGVGDDITLNGQYEWNPKGGVIHWTHHDPSGHHPDGWIRHGGHTYQ